MNSDKWQKFRNIVIVFFAVSMLLLFDQGALGSMDVGGVVIILSSFAAVAYAVYRYLKCGPDDWL